MSNNDPRAILREADRLRSYSRGAESARHKIKMRGEAQERRGIFRFRYRAPDPWQTLTEEEMDAVYIALADVRDKYERYAKEAEARVSTSVIVGTEDANA